MNQRVVLASAIAKTISLIPSEVIQPEGDALWMIEVGRNPHLGDRVVFEVRLMPNLNFRIFKVSYDAETGQVASCTPVSQKDIVLLDDAVARACEAIADYFDIKAEERASALVGLHPSK